MTTLRTILAAVTLFAASAQAQTLKSLMFNSTNGQVVANTGTNVLTFTNTVSFKDGTNVDFSTIEEGRKIKYLGDSRINLEEMLFASSVTVVDNIESPTNIFTISPVAATTRTNLGLGATWLTNNNVTNFRAAIGLGATNEVLFGTVLGGNIESTSFQVQVGGNGIEFEEPSAELMLLNLR